MTFRVETTPAAEQDADAILDWLLSQHAGETPLVSGTAGCQRITW
jgi:hypothetical protein